MAMYSIDTLYATTGRIINVSAVELTPTDEDFQFKDASNYASFIYNPIVIGTNGMILDGHHRVKYCIENGIECLPAVVVVWGETINQAYNTVIAFPDSKSAFAFAEEQCN